MTSLRHSMNLKNGGVISLVGAGGKTALMFRLARELSRQGAAVLSTTTTKIYTPNRKQSSIVMIAESARALAIEARKILKRNPHISAGRRLIPFQNKLKGFPPETIDAIWQSGVFRWIVVEADGAAGKPVKAPAEHEPVIAPSTKWIIGIVSLKALGKPLTERWAFRPQLVSNITGLDLGASITESAIAEVLTSATGMMKGFPAQAKRFAFLNQAESQERLAAGRRIAKLINSHKTAGLAGVFIGQTLYEPIVTEYYPADSRVQGGLK
jgi:probable selenium-dependent hydroxylase accessory protein YqeC